MNTTLIKLWEKQVRIHQIPQDIKILKLLKVIKKLLVFNNIEPSDECIKQYLYKPKKCIILAKKSAESENHQGLKISKKILTDLRFMDPKELEIYQHLVMDPPFNKSLLIEGFQNHQNTVIVKWLKTIKNLLDCNDLESSDKAIKYIFENKNRSIELAKKSANSTNLQEVGITHIILKDFQFMDTLTLTKIQKEVQEFKKSKITQVINPEINKVKKTEKKTHTVKFRISEEEKQIMVKKLKGQEFSDIIRQVIITDGTFEENIQKKLNTNLKNNV